MRLRALSPHTILVVTLALSLASCGGGGQDGAFGRCGNGVVDGSETCDDGNLDDRDACTSTCEPNVCGDGLLNVGVEECDLLATNSECHDARGEFIACTCITEGFGGGTLECTDDCRFDTSGCTGTAGPTATAVVTPTAVGDTPTPTPGASPSPGESPATPTVAATSTPTGGGGETCQSGETIAVTAALDKAYAAFAVTVGYPTEAVNIPGSGNAVGNRVAFAVSGGLDTVSDDDDQGGDGVDDTLHASFVSGVDDPPGPVFTVSFDCIPGTHKPSAGAFACTVVSASTSGADTIPDEVCTLSVQ